jgi:hypothetical protein
MAVTSSTKSNLFAECAAATAEERAAWRLPGILRTDVPRVQRHTVWQAAWARLRFNIKTPRSTDDLAGDAGDQGYVPQREYDS